MQKSQYVSCIYIGGLPILPPLMTTDIRQEMLKYRELAIEIEQKISKRKGSLTQSETVDLTSDPITSINLNSPESCQTKQLPTSLHTQVRHQRSPVRTGDSNPVDAETDNDSEKNLNRSMRRNSYTLETPSPQLMALIRSNQIEDVSFSQDSNSESFTEVSKLSISAKNQNSTFNQCYNANYDVSCPNHKPSESSLGAVSTGSDYDSLSSDVESIVHLTESNEYHPVGSQSQVLHKCDPTQSTHDFESSFGESESSLDVSRIKDLKLLSRGNTWRSPQIAKAPFKSKKKNMNLELRKAYLRKTGVSRDYTSFSLPASLSSSPEPKHLYHSTENITKSPSVSRIPLSTKIPSRYHKLSERSQCSFKNTAMKNHMNEAKKVGRIKHERLFSSLIEDKLNISDDSKSILNQSKLPVYKPLRRSSLGFIPFKPENFLKKNNLTSFSRRPNLNVKTIESQHINEHEDLENLQTEQINDSVSLNSSLCSKEMVMDENKNMQYESPALKESFQKSSHGSKEEIPTTKANSNSPQVTKRRNYSRSSSSPFNSASHDTKNENIYLYLSPSHSNSDVESLIDASPAIESSPALAYGSPGGGKTVQAMSNGTTPVTFSDFTNNNLNASSSSSRTSGRSRKQLNFNQRNTKAVSINNSLNNSFCDTISLSGSENNDAPVSMNKPRGASDLSDAEISDRSVSLLLQELQNKHQQQMDLLKQKQMEEQNMLEQQQRKITETIILNLSNGLSPSSTSPGSVKNGKSPKTHLNHDDIPVNRGITPLPTPDSSSMILFSSTPGFKQTSSVSSLSRYSLPPNSSKIVSNKIWFMNNIPTTKFYPKKNYNELEVKSATIIQAGVRGYFVRRLMRTERVQLLIEMIQKSIKCAFEIQQEPNPTLADYEFHSRLVQQITKACYEIHEIFIVYPQKEKFSIIAADRLKKYQKMNTSTPSVKPLSVATRRSLQRKFSQSSSDGVPQALRKPQRSRSHTFTSSSLHDDLPRRKRYERSATTYSLKKMHRLSYDSRISNELKRRVPWR